MTQKAAAKLLRLSTSTLSDLLHRTITRFRKGHKIKGLTHIGIDEISYCKGRKYATIVYDLKHSKVVWIGKDKGKKTIEKFFKEELLAPTESGHRFRSYPATHSEGNRPLIPKKTLPFFRGYRNFFGCL